MGDGFLRGARGVCAALVLAAASAAMAETPAADRLTTDHYFDLERLSDAQISPDGARIVYARSRASRLSDQWDHTLFIVNADGTENRYFASGTSARWSPDGKAILFLGEGEGGKTQIFVRWIDAAGAPTEITHGIEAVADPKWSPDGRFVAFTGFSPSRPSLKVDLPSPPKGAKWTEAPRIVESLHYRQDRVGFLEEGTTHLFVVAADGGAPRDLTPGDWSVGSGELRGPVAYDWTPDARRLVVEASKDFDRDREYERSQILLVNVEGGVERDLVPEKGGWTSPKVSPDGKTLAFVGFPVTGKTHTVADLYVRPLAGGPMKKLTGALDRDPGNLFWAPDGSGLYFDADDRGARNAFFAALSGVVRPITAGEHVLTLDSVSRTLTAAGTVSDPDHPAEIARYSLRGALALARVTDINRGLLTGRSLAKTQAFSWPSTGGVEVHGWYVTPPDFDPSKKYPLVLEIHGGPFASYNASFNYMWQNLAANGFVVLYLNPRGSTGYGQAFSDGIDHNYPGPDYDDLMAGVDALAKKGFLDPTRLYVSGCSGGGVLSSWVIGRTNRFAAAAVRCPVIDWLSFAGDTDVPLFTYSFFKHPFWEDPSDWLAHSSLMSVGHVTTPTLLMTGVLDRRTPMPQTEEYFAALKVRGVPSALLEFDGEYHGTGSRPSNWIRTELYMMGWFDRWSRSASGTVEARGAAGAAPRP